MFSHIALCVTIVTSVSPSCTSTDASNVSSSLFNLQARAFATAVTDAVISQEFNQNTSAIILCQNRTDASLFIDLNEII